MLFGNGLSALLTLMGISAALVVLFVVGPLALAGAAARARAAGSRGCVYFGALGAGFMLIEVSVLQRFVLLLGHPVYSLTVTLFSLLLGTGARRGVEPAARRATLRRDRRDRRSWLIAAIALRRDRRRRRRSSTWAIPFSRAARMLIAVAMLVPIGVAARHPDADRHPPAAARARRRW